MKNGRTRTARANAPTHVVAIKTVYRRRATVALSVVIEIRYYAVGEKAAPVGVDGRGPRITTQPRLPSTTHTFAARLTD